ncbi:SDR family NAD(P)-dependent oxidoreductase [Sporosarcina sp. FA9]|uniref:SDR family NAD(P)-dependent oxidoreductase n=1 Tax=Sporosarcina sp. FA9 TaxID=3413030 RepID=UPI003F65D868
MEKLVAEGYDCIGIRCDVTNETDIQQAIDQTVERYDRLDVLVNNAGMQHIALIEDFPTERFELMTKIMLVATFMAIKYVMPLMKEQQFGRIINMASINVVVEFAGKATYNRWWIYCAVK